MFRSKLTKVIRALIAFILVSVFSFSIIHLAPGDPVELMFGKKEISEKNYLEINRSLGFDKSLFDQYVVFISRAARGDLGKSFLTKEPVLDEFLSRLPATIELATLAIIIAIFVGVLLGMYAARNRGKPLDYFLMGGALLGYSMPIFWQGLLFILFFSVGFEWFPVSGRSSFLFETEPVTGFLLIDSLLGEGGFRSFLDAFHHLALPVVILSTTSLSSVARVTRHSIVNIMNEDYIRTARSKGLSKNKIFFKHALRNAYVPILTVIGVGVGSLITGTIVIETLFSWPGVGSWMVARVEARDYPSVQGGMLLISGMIIFLNVAMNMAYGLADSRIKV